MKLPIWTKPALAGAAVGAIALAIVGFGWGGWMTGASANSMSIDAADAAVAQALLPYCVEQAQATGSVAALEEVKAASAYSRQSLVEKAGWATPLGSDKPNRELARACQLKLTEAL